jgi:hypothetical protein
MARKPEITILDGNRAHGRDCGADISFSLDRQLIPY